MGGSKVEKFRISVRSLVEFLLHSGDIDGGKGGMADTEAGYTGKYRAAWEPDTDRKFL